MNFCLIGFSFQVDSHLEEYEKVLDADDPEGGWVDTHHFADASVTALSEKVVDMTLPAESGAASGDRLQTMDTGDADDDEDDDEEAEDMEAFAQSGLLDEADEESLAQRTKPQPSAKQAESAGATGGTSSGTGGEILVTRTYDLNITYDKFYQTPRLWLFGYDEQRRPLTVEQMYEDLRWVAEIIEIFSYQATLWLKLSDIASGFVEDN